MVTPHWGMGVDTAGLWNLSANREKPKFVIFRFILTGELVTNNLSNLKVHLNSESHPYVNLNFDFIKNQYAHLYEMYTRYQSSYYNREFYWESSAH